MAVLSFTAPNVQAEGDFFPVKREVRNFKSQLEESKSSLGAGCEGATKAVFDNAAVNLDLEKIMTGVLDDEADLTAYDGIGSKERMLLLKGFVISKMFFGQKALFFLKLRANQAKSSQSNEVTDKTSSGKGALTNLVALIGHKQYKRSAKDVYYFLQCLKQLGYGLLELILNTVFPELQEVIINIHEKKKDPKVKITSHRSQRFDV
ncbi:hypothetical protein Tco_0496256 [Tanacetum coccineum]